MELGADKFARFLGEQPEKSIPEHDKTPDTKKSTESPAEREDDVPKVKFLFITIDCRGLHLRVDDATLSSFIVAEAYTGTSA